MEDFKTLILLVLTLIFGISMVLIGTWATIIIGSFFIVLSLVLEIYLIIYIRKERRHLNGKNKRKIQDNAMPLGIL